MYTKGIHLMSVIHSSQRETGKFAQNMSGVLISFVGQQASSVGKDTAAKPDNLCSMRARTNSPSGPLTARGMP